MGVYIGDNIYIYIYKHMGVYIYMKCVGKCVFHVVKISYLRIIKNIKIILFYI